MSVTVELFGIPRQRAGLGKACVEGATIGEALTNLARQCPGFAEACLPAGSLAGHVTLNVNGARFVADLSTPLCDGDVLLVLSGDAGG